MDAFEREYQLSLYNTLAVLNNSKKSEILLVQNSLTGRIYIKKILKNYNLDVYQALKQIQTIHIPTIYEIFEEEKTLIIIEEFINGRTLEDMMTEGGVLSEKEAISYMIKLCESLEFLHKQTPPIIHRDIKPSNIMITNDGILKLIDFDVSRIYRQESEVDTHILGTKGYASPEQFGFEQTDGRSDIYSIGVLLNVLTMGDNPKVKKNSSPLGNIIDKCTQFLPDDRYQHIGELKMELSKYLNSDVKKSELKMESSFQENHEWRKIQSLFLDSYEWRKIQLLFQENHEWRKIQSLLRPLFVILNLLTFANFYQLVTRKTYVSKEPKSKIIRELRQLPGYRSGNIIYAPFATYWYAFLIYGAFFTTKEPNVFLLLENIYMAFVLLLLILFNSNYKGCKTRLPLMKSNRIIGMVIYNFGIFISFGIVQEILRKLNS